MFPNVFQLLICLNFLFVDNPLHSTAVFSGDLEENDENDKGDEYLAPSYGREKPIRQPGEKVRTKKG